MSRVLCEHGFYLEHCRTCRNKELDRVREAFKDIPEKNDEMSLRMGVLHQKARAEAAEAKLAALDPDEIVQRVLVALVGGHGVGESLCSKCDVRFTGRGNYCPQCHKPDNVTVYVTIPYPKFRQAVERAVKEVM